jgi:hypothetical protein
MIRARRLGLAASLLSAGLCGCFTFRPMNETLRDRPLSLERLRPAQIDVEASSVSLEARANLGLQSDILRVQIADALNAELGDAGGPTPRPARFRAKVVASESNNLWAAALAPFTLVFAGMLPYVKVTVRVELGLDLRGGEQLFAVGVGAENVTALAPKMVAEALQAALGLALNDALGQLQPARAVAQAEPR